MPPTRPTLPGASDIKSQPQILQVKVLRPGQGSPMAVCSPGPQPRLLTPRPLSAHPELLPAELQHNGAHTWCQGLWGASPQWLCDQQAGPCWGREMVTCWPHLMAGKALCPPRFWPAPGPATAPRAPTRLTVGWNGECHGIFVP